MLAGYPLGWFMNLFVKGTYPRHLFSIILGVFLQLYMFRGQIIHPFIMTLTTYFLMTVLPRNQQHKVVFAFVMLYLSFSHIYRMITNFGGYDMDITTFTMLLTTRLSALGFCYKDGGEPEEKISVD